MDRVRVLIVDDSPEAREGLRSILASQPDIDVAGVAGNGQEAVLMIEQLSPDVALVDAQMPGMDGAATTRLIKQHAPRVKVLFLTVHADYVDDAIAAGADLTLMKDSGRRELAEAVRSLAAQADST